jgi:hypothetical protein
MLVTGLADVLCAHVVFAQTFSQSSSQHFGPGSNTSQSTMQFSTVITKWMSATGTDVNTVAEEFQAAREVQHQLA